MIKTSNYTPGISIAPSISSFDTYSVEDHYEDHTNTQVSLEIKNYKEFKEKVKKEIKQEEEEEKKKKKKEGKDCSYCMDQCCAFLLFLMFIGLGIYFYFMLYVNYDHEEMSDGVIAAISIEPSLIS